MGIQISPVVQKRSPDRNRDLRVLLIGENAQGCSHLVDRLRARGCKCEHVNSYEAACSLLRTQDFCVVLSPTRLHKRSCLPLMGLLEGSDITLFYAEPVEQGCWWLPALRRGIRCFGSCAVRASEFVSTLIETIDAFEST